MLQNLPFQTSNYNTVGFKLQTYIVCRWVFACVHDRSVFLVIIFNDTPVES